MYSKVIQLYIYIYICVCVCLSILFEILFPFSTGDSAQSVFTEGLLCARHSEWQWRTLLRNPNPRGVYFLPDASGRKADLALGVQGRPS